MLSIIIQRVFFGLLQRSSLGPRPLLSSLLGGGEALASSVARTIHSSILQAWSKKSTMASTDSKTCSLYVSHLDEIEIFLRAQSASLKQFHVPNRSPVYLELLS